MKIQVEKSYLEASARDRIANIVDKESFKELCAPPQKVVSPHLHYFGRPVEFDDGVVIGEAMLDGKEIFIFAQEGRFMGGAIGEVHSAKIVGLLKRALIKKPFAIIGLIDSGGVRLEEANAGEIGATEIARAILDARNAGILLIGAIGGSCGAYGGMSIISGLFDYLIISEEGRIGVSGPEVIETNMGVEVFDAEDRALVWRTFGGKNRYLQKQVDAIVENTIPAFKEGLISAMALSKTKYSNTFMQEELALLQERYNLYKNCDDAYDVWQTMGIKDYKDIPSFTAQKMQEIKK